MEKKRILLIDDETTFTRTLKSYLEKMGHYEVREEHNGADGLTAAVTFQPQLIFLDIIMPDVDGGHVAERLKADPRTAHMPIVFLTAVVSREETREHAGLIGGQAFIAKPISMKEILECIERYLGKEVETAQASGGGPSG